MLVIDDEGNRLGEFLTEDAIRLAEDRGLDLVEVAPNGRPPVCRIADYGRMKYDRKKKQAAARRNQVQVQLKEVKLRPKTETHDFQTKMNRARRFLGANNRVKVTIMFRGREMAYTEAQRKRLEEIAQQLSDIAIVDVAPKIEGRTMSMMLNPKKGGSAASASSEKSDKGNNTSDDNQSSTTVVSRVGRLD